MNLRFTRAGDALYHYAHLQYIDVSKNNKLILNGSISSNSGGKFIINGYLTKEDAIDGINATTLFSLDNGTYINKESDISKIKFISIGGSFYNSNTNYTNDIDLAITIK